eukprot:1552632-Alexandrium_andersonii.AAC.1
MFVRCPASNSAGDFSFKLWFVYVHCFTTPPRAMRSCSLKLRLLRDATSGASKICERSSVSNARGSGELVGPNTMQLALLIPSTDRATIVDGGPGGGREL